jgi:aerobic carbon-monoxide dehydrogenase large subunit
VSSQILTSERIEPKSDILETQVIGLPLKRKEDPRIVSGLTRYVDDIKLPGTLFGAVLRSQQAHAKIKKIDVSGAKNYPGVVLVLTSKDIPSHAATLPSLELKDGSKIRKPVLADREVCYHGEPIAFVVADSRYSAEDAIDLIDMEYEPLPVVVDPLEAIKESSPKVHIGIGSNLVQVETVENGDVEAAFEKAAKVVKLDLLNQRVAPAPLEPRAILAQYDQGTQVLSVWMSTQGPFQNRSDFVDLLQIPENKIRVFAPDVGGGFGAKLSVYPEDVLVCLAALKLGRPVKWIENRSENFLSMTHGRGQNQHVELASNEKGRILGLKVRLVGDAGAYYTEGSSDATFTLKMCPGQYIVPSYKGEAYIALTNKVPHDAYRGASRPEATYLIERGIDELARELKVEPEEIRLRNFIPKENFPYKTVTDLDYDTGDYSSNLKRALELSNYERWRETSTHWNVEIHWHRANDVR